MTMNIVMWVTFGIIIAGGFYALLHMNTHTYELEFDHDDLGLNTLKMTFAILVGGFIGGLLALIWQVLVFFLGLMAVAGAIVWCIRYFARRKESLDVGR